MKIHIACHECSNCFDMTEKEFEQIMIEANEGKIDAIVLVCDACAEETDAEVQESENDNSPPIQH